MARIVGDFELLEKLGSGLQGKVYRVRHTSTGAVLAAKFIDQDSLRGNSKMLTNLQREITAMERVAAHPHVVGVKHVNFDVMKPRKKRPGAVRRCVMIVMDIASGGELFDYLMIGKFEEAVARTYVKQLLEALHFAHGNGVVHRDIKPENLLLGKGYELRVADWGLSAVIDDVSSALLRSQCGTRAYMAPEILRREAYRGEPADMWSTGCVLFIMLSGFPPFEMAAPGDWWFDRIRTSQYSLFWQAHERAMRFSPEAKDLLNGIFVSDPSRRLRVEDAMKHPWCGGPTVDAATLATEMTRRRRDILARKPGAAAAAMVDTAGAGGALTGDISMGDAATLRGGASDPFAPMEVVRSVALPARAPTMGARIMPMPAGDIKAAAPGPALDVPSDVSAALLPVEVPSAGRVTWFTLTTPATVHAVTAALAGALNSVLHATVAVRTDGGIKLKARVATATGPVRMDVRLYDVAGAGAAAREHAASCGVPSDAAFLVDVQRAEGDAVAFNTLFIKLREEVAAQLGDAPSTPVSPPVVVSTPVSVATPVAVDTPSVAAGSAADSLLDSTVSDTVGVL